MQACYDVKSLPKQAPKLDYMKNRLRAYKIRCEKKGERPQTSKGCCGPKVDAIDLYEERVDELEHKVRGARERRGAQGLPPHRGGTRVARVHG